MSKFWTVLGLACISALVVSIAIGQPIVAFAAIILSWPFVIPAANLGCHRCNYNIFLPYRGLSSSEHGDSWTHPDIERRLWAKHLKVPETCPKCEALILTLNAAQHNPEQSK
jgi:hypothetical protein